MSDSLLYQRALKEMKESLRMILNTMSGESESVDKFVQKTVAKIDEANAAYVFTDAVREFADYQLSNKEASAEERLAFTNKISAKLSSLNLTMLSPNQRDTVQRVIASVKSKEDSLEDIIRGMTESLLVMSDDMASYRANSKQLTTDAHSHIKHNDNDVVAADLQAASKRLTRDLTTVCIALNQGFPNDDLVRELSQRVQAIKGKPNAFFEALDVMGELANRIKLVIGRSAQQTQDMLEDIQSKILSFCDNANIIENLTSQAGSNTDSFQSELIKKLDELKSKSAKSRSLEDCQNSINDSLSAVTGLIDAYVKKQKQNEVASKNRISTLNDELSVALGKIKRLKLEVNDVTGELLIDDLTKINNRRGYTKFVEVSQKKLAEGEIDNLSMIVIDIDKFKSVNDTYGHAIGDQVLRRVASLASDVIGEDDHLARYGGEEFVIVCPNKSASEAAECAQKLRTAINQRRFTIRESNEKLKITLSCGVASFESRTDDYKVVFKRADEALYKAKNTGRDKTVVSKGDKHYNARSPIKEKVTV